MSSAALLFIAAFAVLAVKRNRRARFAAAPRGAWVAAAVAFVAGVAWALSQGPSVLNAGVCGVGLALLGHAGYQAFHRTRVHQH